MPLKRYSLDSASHVLSLNPTVLKRLIVVFQNNLNVVIDKNNPVEDVPLSQANLRLLHRIKKALLSGNSLAELKSRDFTASTRSVRLRNSNGYHIRHRSLKVRKPNNQTLQNRNSEANRLKPVRQSGLMDDLARKTFQFYKVNNGLTKQPPAPTVFHQLKHYLVKHKLATQESHEPPESQQRPEPQEPIMQDQDPQGNSASSQSMPMNSNHQKNLKQKRPKSGTPFGAAFKMKPFASSSPLGKAPEEFEAILAELPNHPGQQSISTRLKVAAGLLLQNRVSQ
ncbi:MAG: hypothetical protein AAGI66_02550 [Cyanobacteria bacterium P01_H01_bin.74]